MENQIQIEQTRFNVNSRIIESALTPNRDTFKALCELINNSLQASAKEIKITIDTDSNKNNELFEIIGISRIVIEDNGVGVSKSDFNKKILEMATNTKTDGKGIGRFSTFQLGHNVTFETVAKDENNFIKTSVQFDYNKMKNSNIKDLPINISHQVTAHENSYFKITITNMCHRNEAYKDKKHYQISYKLNTDYAAENNIWYHIFINYATNIINDKVKFIINDKELDIDKYKIASDNLKKEFTDIDGNKHTLEYEVIQYNSDKPHTNKTICLMVDNNNIKSIGTEYEYKINTPDTSSWRIYAYSDYINNMADSFRNIHLLEDMDEDILKLRDIIYEHLNSFFYDKYQSFFNFEKSLKKHESYPYKNQKAPSETHEIVYSRFCYCIEEKYKILEKENALTKVIYPLVSKCIESGDITELLDKIGSLPKKTVRQFKDLLEKADLEYVVSFSSEVATKKEFLEFLSKLADNPLYKKKITETDQLHKIIEQNLWLFGAEYNGAKVIQSNKSIGNTFKKLREKYLLATDTVEKNNDRMDLFVWTELEKDEDNKEVLVVELKRFSVNIGEKELSQIRKYRYAIETEAALSKLGVSYKLILISSKIEDIVRSDMANKTTGLYSKNQEYNISTYIYTWADIIEKNQKKLSYLGEYLRVKDKDVLEYIKDNYSEDINMEKLKSSINTK